MNLIRAAILVAFVGAILWVFAPAMLTALVREPEYTTTTTPTGIWAGIQEQVCVRGCDHDKVARTVESTSRTTILVATIAGVAWILAGMIKPKG